MIQMLSTYFESLRSDERGQGLVEYALIIALVAIVLIASLNALAVDIGSFFSTVTDKLEACTHRPTPPSLPLAGSAGIRGGGFFCAGPPQG